MAPYPPQGCAGFKYEHQPIMLGWWGWGFHIVRGVVDPGGNYILLLGLLEL